MQKLVILTGPTSVGKTNLSIALAKAIDGEIISADSMQVYKYMNIGSAKIKKEEMQGVPHHLVDYLDPHEDYNVFMFQKHAKEAMEQIYKNGHIPILVGGTGFYIQSVLYDIDFSQNEIDDGYRKELEQIAICKGAKYLHDMLYQVDEKAAQDIHENNVKRVIRALEYFHQTGEKISEHNEIEKNKKSPYDFTYFVLNDDREKLYKRIDDRVDQMLNDGLVDEVKSLKEMGLKREDVSMQGLGYKEILDYLDNKCTLEEAVYLIKRDTRHFAKRQLTWFRREQDAIMVQKNDFHYEDEKILEFMLKKIYRNDME